MLDERWSADVTEMRAALRDVLAGSCSTDEVRRMEDGGDTSGVDDALTAFGLDDLPENAEYLAGAAWELGASLAPGDWIDRTAVHDADGGLGQLLGAARLTGAGAALLELVRAYACERRQFNQPIGAFQAVAHRLADAAIAVDAAELLVLRATVAARDAGTVAVPQPFAHMAWSRACRSAEFVATSAHQVMGGYGFATEYDCQLYSRAIRRWTRQATRASTSSAAVARQLLDPAARDAVVGLWHHDRGLPLPRWARELDLERTAS